MYAMWKRTNTRNHDAILYLWEGQAPPGIRLASRFSITLLRRLRLKDLRSVETDEYKEP